MRILELISTLNPAYGGPVDGLRHMTHQLTTLGHIVEVACLDNPRSNWLENFAVKVHPLGPGFFNYKFSIRMINWLSKNSKNYDLLIINGVWQFHGFAVYLTSIYSKIPYFVYTHGMLDPWFKNAFPMKHIKKQIYWFLAEYWILKNASSVIFTTEEERRLSKTSFKPYHLNQAVINFGIKGGNDFTSNIRNLFFDVYPELIGKKIILFLSRIHHKKGCDLLIEAFSRIYGSDESYQLVMVGNDQESLKSTYEVLAAKLGIASRITWTGMVTEDLKWSAYHSCEVFILPSHSENFGSAVVEALSIGKPVLITNKVNIWREIASYNACFVENDDLNGVILLLLKWSMIEEGEKIKMSMAAKRCFHDLFQIESAAKNLSNYLNDFIINDKNRN